uniref:CSON001894 protein n=1 Tax=Culicoides sonorensis TaxID=179676 RepID=A0A336MJ47_CULSO
MTDIAQGLVEPKVSFQTSMAIENLFPGVFNGSLMPLANSNRGKLDNCCLYQVRQFTNNKSDTDRLIEILENQLLPDKAATSLLPRTLR